MPTVISTTTPYCTPTQLLSYVDWQMVADALLDDPEAPRPVKATILSSTSAHGIMLNELCMAASGAVESKCLARELYSAADLAALTGATASFLRKIVAGLVILELFSRRMPVTAILKNVPVAQVATDALEELGAGKRIFGLVAQADAGDGFRAITVEDSLQNNQRFTVTRAYRLFGNRDRYARDRSI